jgi:ferredoxin-NADP reductase
MVEKQSLRLIEVKDETKDSYSLYLEKRFSFLPGQFLIIEENIPIEQQPKRTRRSYSISSSPLDPFIKVTIRRVPGGLMSNYLRDSVKVGSTIGVEGPFGKFHFIEDDSDDLVFIAGGAGIAPIIGMIRYILQRGENKRMLLLYSSRNREEIIFKEEIESIQEQNKGFRAEFTLTRESDLTWQGRVGRINFDFLKSNIDDPTSKVYYICGPPQMVTDVVASLNKLDVDITRIRTEAW